MCSTVTYMGMFDRVHTGNRCGQTKAFDSTLSDLTPGCPVNRADSQYAMHEGGWLIVRDGHIVSWDDEADEVLPRYNNGANPLGGDGEVSDSYRYSTPTRAQSADRQRRLREMVGRDGEPSDDEIDDAHRTAVRSAAGIPDRCPICAELLADSAVTDPGSAGSDSGK